MKVLVTGGRDFNDAEMVWRVLGELHAKYKFTLLVHGDARGLDRIAGQWAENAGIEVLACPADWKAHGRAAGPMRNKQMLEHKPELLVAFPGGRGTADMVRKAERSSLLVVHATAVFSDKS